MNFLERVARRWRREARSLQAVENDAGHRPILAEVARMRAAAGLDLESVREVLLANMLAEQHLPIRVSRQVAAGTQSRAGARYRRIDLRSSELHCN